MSLKMEFAEKAAKPGTRMSALCRQYGISRETGYKWLNRFKRDGYNGLEEKSRRPRSTPLATAEELVLAILESREAHPKWGPKKLGVVLRRRYAEQTPSDSTIARILRRFGRVRQRRAVRQLSVVEKAPNVQAKVPNEIWTVDFKGWWRVRDGRRCEPLTVRDGFSRYVLAVKVMQSTKVDPVRSVFEKLFRKHGVPQMIQCDNGSPFISTMARGGLTQLSAWWIALGIKVVRSRPGCPQDNGAHERMHRDLRADVELFPEGTLSAEQRACEKWRQEFNHVRPHEALGGKTPAAIYRPTVRREAKIMTYVYPSGWLVRTVSPGGGISVQDDKYRAGRSLAGQRVGLEPLTGLRHRMWFRDLDLGELELCPSTETVSEAASKFTKHPLRKAA